MQDLTAEGAGAALTKYTRAELEGLIYGVVAGEAAKRIAKLAKPHLRKAFDRVKTRLEQAAKGKKLSKLEAEQEFRKVLQDLQGVAENETDAEARKLAREIADDIEAKAKQAAEKVSPKAAKPRPTAEPAQKRQRNRDQPPKQKPIEPSRKKHGNEIHDATAYNRSKRWASDPETVAGTARFNQELVDATGRVHPELKPDSQRVRVMPDNRRVVDIVEVQSPTQSEKQMDEKIERYKKLLGSQAGEIRWVPPVEGSSRE